MAYKVKTWLGLSILFAVLAVLAAILTIRFGNSLQVLEKTDLSTGVQNRCLGYDESRDIILLGTYTNKLIAYKEGEKLWEMDAKGPFRKLILHSQEGKVYAGNEDNYVYVINIEDGSVESSINVQRRIYDIAVREDGSEIAVSAGTAVNKHNILIYNKNGELLQNNKYKSIIQRLCYSYNEENLIFINNRGEVTEATKQGKELTKYKVKYELVDLIYLSDNEEYLAMCTDTSYYVLDKNLKLVNRGKPNVGQTLTATRIYKDVTGNYTIIGTKEGYLYVMNKDNVQIYSTRLENSISDMTDIGEDIYVTGIGDWVYSMHRDSLRGVALAGTVTPVVKTALFLFAGLALISVLMLIPATHRGIMKCIKLLYKHRMPYFLLVTTLNLLVFFNHVPVTVAFTRAFTNWSKDFNTLSEIRWVGLDNFRLMLEEGYFLTGLGNLALMMAAGFVKVLTVPILIAYLVYSMFSSRKKYVFRFLFVLPIVVPSVVSALLWKQIYDPTIGLLNQLLNKVGLENLQRVWLGDEKTAIWAIIFMGFPFVNALAFLVFYGGFLDIDMSMLEAARVDGANRLKIFWRIMIPLIKPQIKMIMILTFIGVVQDFTPIYILTGGGPGTSTYVPGLELYYNATQFGRYGYACALGVVMFLFVMILTAINMHKKKEEREV